MANEKKYLDKKGLAYFWELIKKTINLKTDAITKGMVGEKTDDGGEIFNYYDNDNTTIPKNEAANLSHAEGLSTQAKNEAEHAEGKYNKSNTSTDPKKQTIHSIGIGTSDADRKNALEVTASGDVYIKGVNGYDGTNPGSNNTIQNNITDIYNKIENIYNGEAGIIDDKLSLTSTNAVQNKLVTTALNKKVDKVAGKGLSTNDFTNELKDKLNNLNAGSFTASASAKAANTTSASVNLSKTGKFTFEFEIEKGEKGDKGDNGTPGIVSRTVFAYKASDTKPNKPTGGYWDVATNQITYPTGWTATDSTSTTSNIVWMSTNDFGPDGNPTREWSDPLRITGTDGKNGADGTSIEFIYKLTKTSFVVLDTPTNNANVTDYVPEGWTDSPTGITVEMQTEWMCSRKLLSTGKWGNWSAPAIWSKWGVDGKDGDGVEYIYTLTTGSAPIIATYDNNSTAAQKDGYIPPQGTNKYPWTDNPTGVSKNTQYEWVSVRKYSSETGKWGVFSTPALWAKYGIDGYNGLSVITRYAVTTTDTPPAVAKTNINPGSLWSIAVPDKGNNKILWWIQGTVNYKNELQGEWQGPWLLEGKNTISGNEINFRTYVYKKSDTKPTGPTSNDPQNPGNGWIDYPNDTGQWWQCIGLVNGTTGFVDSWGEVIPLNGRDGIAQDGKFVEWRFLNYSTYPTIADKTVRKPLTTGDSKMFTLQPVYPIPTGYNMYITNATILPDDTVDTSVNGGWSLPVRINGENGIDGKDGINGSQGISGIPGVTYEARYMLGNENGPKNTWQTSDETIRIPTGWTISVPIPATGDEENIYIWFTQCRIKFKDNTELTNYANNPDDYGTIVGKWSKPARLSGINGIGKPGRKGQIVYPAGIYNENLTYTCDDNSTPYVYDTDTKEYYILNKYGSFTGKTDAGGKPLAQITYVNSDGNTENVWLKAENYEAIFAQVAVIANGLVGSAVFNGRYMFSQKGIKKDVEASITDLINLNVWQESDTTIDFHKFNPDDPYNSSNDFRPLTCFDLENGDVWFCAGNIYVQGNKGRITIKYANIEHSNIGYSKINESDITNCNVQTLTAIENNKKKSTINAENRGEYIQYYPDGITKRMEIGDGNIKYYNNDGTLKWILGEDGTIKRDIIICKELELFRVTQTRDIEYTGQLTPLTTYYQRESNDEYNGYVSQTEYSATASIPGNPIPDGDYCLPGLQLIQGNGEISPDGSGTTLYSVTYTRLVYTYTNGRQTSSRFHEWTIEG